MVVYFTEQQLDGGGGVKPVQFDAAPSFPKSTGTCFSTFCVVCRVSTWVDRETAGEEFDWAMYLSIWLTSCQEPADKEKR